ncbi:MAG: hypothetical protein WCD53_31070 [Microcoleus sp.]
MRSQLLADLNMGDRIETQETGFFAISAHGKEVFSQKTRFLTTRAFRTNPMGDRPQSNLLHLQQLNITNRT